MERNGFTGLNTQQVNEKRELFGLNELPGDRKVMWFGILLKQFKSPLIYILLSVVIFSLLYREYLDVTLTLSVVILNVVMGFFQEYKAHRTSESLKQLIRPHSLVLRNGLRKKIDIKFLVPDDIVILGPGDKIPADGIILEGSGLLVKEAILTGEAEAIAKKTQGDSNLYMGTDVIAGEGYMQVKHIGTETQLGKIGKNLISIESVETPLQKKLKQFSRKLGLIVIVLCITIFILGVISGRDPSSMLRLSVILSVAAIPEGLPISVTIVLAIATNRILKRNGLVKQLASVETLGSTTVICLDKTGTLTEGNMKVIRTKLHNEDRVVSAVLLANDQRTNLEIAVWEYVSEHYKNKFDNLQKDIIRKYEEPFSSERKYSFTIGELHKQKFAYIIGAPDIVLEFCNLSKSEKKRHEQLINEWTDQGLRLLAFASKEGKEGEKLKKFEWNGIIGIEDPLRNEARETILRAQEAGLSVKIITGDHMRTALSIAKDLGLIIKDENVITGNELEDMDPTILCSRIKQITLFARVTPAHKLKIVQCLQDQGEIVAMTGDGVNDAQALKRADIGVVMGDSSDLAKESGDLILLDNDFRTIIAAIEQGRLLFLNMKKMIAYMLSDAFEEIVIIFGSLVLGLPSPLSIAQILVIHLICDGPPDIALGFEPKEQDLIKIKSHPRESRTKQLLDKELILIISGISLITGIMGLGIFYWALRTLDDLQTAQTITFASIAAIDLIYVFSFKSLRSPIHLKGLLNNKWLIWSSIYGFSILLAAIYVPSISSIVGTVPLAYKYLLIQVGIGLSAMGWVELVKYLTRRSN